MSLIRPRKGSVSRRHGPGRGSGQRSTAWAPAPPAPSPVPRRGHFCVFASRLSCPDSALFTCDVDVVCSPLPLQACCCLPSRLRSPHAPSQRVPSRLFLSFAAESVARACATPLRACDDCEGPRCFVHLRWALGVPPCCGWGAPVPDGSGTERVPRDAQFYWAVSLTDGRARCLEAAG